MSSRLCADLYKHFQDIKNFARFLQYSKGSCGELRTQIYIVIDIDIDYIEPAVGKKWIQETKKTLGDARRSQQIPNEDKLV